VPAKRGAKVMIMNRYGIEMVGKIVGSRNARLRVRMAGVSGDRRRSAIGTYHPTDVKYL